MAEKVPRAVSAQANQRVRGTQDLYGDELARFDHVVETFNRVRKLYGFRRVDVPVFEFTSVFARSLGETTDVVSKEMYSFEDRGGESLTLRPEFTAGIARAFISNGWQQHAPMKLAAHGPLFRYERPQKGRFRQFHQLDAEVIGAAEPAADVEVISMAAQLLRELGVSGGVTLQLNTMGDPVTRSAWSQANTAYFQSHVSYLSFESQQRLRSNPLRILDSKEEQDKEFVANAPDIVNYMSSEADRFFSQLTAGLSAAGVKWERNPRLVRGLDYYRHSVFEFVTDRLGAQGTVLGGGRYDGLIGSMGGPPTPAVGWAAGIERLAMLLEFRDYETRVWTIIPECEEAEPIALSIASILRNAGIPIDMTYAGVSRKRLERAKKRDITSAIFVDIPPFDSDAYALLNMKAYRRFEFSELDRLAKVLEHAFSLKKEFNLSLQSNGAMLKADLALWPKSKL